LNFFVFYFTQFVEAMGNVLGMKQEMESLLPDSRNSVVISEEKMENGSMDTEGRMGGQIMVDIDANEDYLQQQQNKNKLKTVNIVAELCELFGQIDSCGQGTIK
jgi:hypothetical protein